MDKKTIAILLVASSLTSSVFANNVFHQIITKNSSAPSTVKTHKLTQNNNRSYTDFSGNWNMDCENAINVPVVIENDDESISFDGMDFRIGRGLGLMSKTNEQESNYSYDSFEWNADRTALMIKMVFLNKTNAENSDIETVAIKSTFTMKNGQIILDGHVLAYVDEPNKHSIPIHCVFSKKQ